MDTWVCSDLKIRLEIKMQNLLGHKHRRLLSLPPFSPSLPFALSVWKSSSSSSSVTVSNNSCSRDSTENIPGSFLIQFDSEDDFAYM
ncbi:uncharacterized protein V6R79_016255 [Siganus canaliculatus]